MKKPALLASFVVLSAAMLAQNVVNVPYDDTIPASSATPVAAGTVELRVARRSLVPSRACGYYKSELFEIHLFPDGTAILQNHTDCGVAYVSGPLALWEGKWSAAEGGVNIDWTSRYFGAPELEKLVVDRIGDCRKLTLFVAFRGTLPVAQFLVPNELRTSFGEWYRPDKDGSLFSSGVNNLKRGEKETPPKISATTFERTTEYIDWAKERDALKARTRS